MSKNLLKPFIALFLFFPLLTMGQVTYIDLDDDGDGEYSDNTNINGNANTKEVHEHTGDLTFKSTTDLTLQLNHGVILDPGGDDTYYNYIIIDGNVIIESGAVIDIKNDAVFIITGNLTIEGTAQFHNDGYFIVLGDVTGSGTIDPANGVGALPAYIGGEISDDVQIIDTDTEVESPLDIPDADVEGILDFEKPNWTADLPVELISFTASKLGNTVQLNWSTASEVNASHFEVYSSVDNRNWDYVGQVQASGNSATRIDYTFIDDQEYATTVYYKLVQFDFDSQNETFGPLAVHFSDNESNFNTSVYPNPSSSGKTSIQINGMSSGSTTTLQLMSKEGKVVLLDTIDSSTITSAVYQLEDKIDLKPGLYILKISSGTTQDTQKIIIQ